MMSPLYSQNRHRPRSRTLRTNRNFMNLDSDHLAMSGNVTLKRDRKAKDCWLVTTTDSEGFHRQLAITFDDMRELVRLWIEETI